jgi:hypothetical protein
MGWAEPVACIGEMKNAYKVLVGKPETDDSDGSTTLK